MAAKRISGISNLTLVPKKASTAFSVASFVTFDAATGFIKPLVASDPSVFGVIQQPIASTDADFSSNTPVLVDQGALELRCSNPICSNRRRRVFQNGSNNKYRL